jgi:hypothetical protein
VSSVDAAVTWEPRDDAGDLVAVAFADLVPTAAPDPSAGRACPADHADHCGDTYCESCVDGVLYRCSSIGPTDDLPAC